MARRDTAHIGRNATRDPLPREGEGQGEGALREATETSRTGSQTRFGKTAKTILEPVLKIDWKGIASAAVRMARRDNRGILEGICSARGSLSLGRERARPHRFVEGDLGRGSHRGSRRRACATATRPAFSGCCSPDELKSLGLSTKQVADLTDKISRREQGVRSRGQGASESSPRSRNGSISGRASRGGAGGDRRLDQGPRRV